MTAVQSNKKLLRDQAARDLIVRELQGNVMVLAGAGAGKTYALVERMVAVIRSGTAEIDRMAAITFTRKAAGEMRIRFYTRLRNELESVTTRVEAERVQKAIDGVDRCFIGTIHAFCSRMLRERPLDAGLIPDFTELEERRESVLRRRAWDEFVQSAYLSDDRRLQELDEHGIAEEDLYFFFGRRCADPDLPLKRTTTRKPDLLSLVPQIVSFIEESSAHLPAHPTDPDKLMMALRRARHFIDNHGVKSNRDVAVLLGMLDGSPHVTLNRWPNRTVARKIRDETLPRFVSTLVQPALRQWRECAYRVVTDFADEAVSYYARVRQQEAHVTFQDLLVLTSEMLRTKPDVRSYFQRRFAVLFVDEFQDTDPIQAHILFYLTGNDNHETDWRKLSPRPGSLFLVGDDKQSIYRFRRADVEVFHLVAQKIRDTGGHVVHLNTSFRSLGNLCRWISSSFQRIFTAEGDPYQAPFQPLFDYREAGIDPFCVRKITIPKIKFNPRADVAAKEADRIVGFISAALRGATACHPILDSKSEDSKVSAGDFLILTRTTSQIPVFTQALERAGIPYDIAGGGRLGDMGEIRALIDLLSTIYEPNNALHLLAYLRGPIVGLSDADFYAIRRAGGRFLMGTPIPEELDQELRERVEQAMEQLEEAKRDLTSRPPGAAVERIVERLGLLSFAAVHPDGRASSRAGSLIRLLSLIRAHAANGWGWGRIIEDLTQLVHDETYAVEEMTLEIGRSDVVRIMNVHQAKGLQAPVVFLADCCDTSHIKEPRSHVCRRSGDQYLSVVVTKPRGDYGLEIVAQPEDWENDRSEEARFAAAEEVRLLYVAATRARNLLIVSKYDGRPDKGPWSPLYSYLSEVPELPGFEPAAAVVSASNEDPRFSSARRAVAVRVEASKEPTHSTRTISGAIADAEFVPYGHEGRGRDYGVIVHQLFDEAVSGQLPANVDKYVRCIIRDAGLGAHYVADALGALNRLRTSDLWRDINKAKQVYTEVPVGSLLNGNEHRSIVRGTIDLVYKDAGGWRIIDYKTDAAATEEELECLRRKYASQIQEYAAYWASVTGEPVESGFWFVHGPPQDAQLTLF